MLYNFKFMLYCALYLQYVCVSIVIVHALHIISEPGDHETFLNALGSNGTIKPANEGGDDAEFETNNKPDTVMYEILMPTDDNNEDLNVKEIATGLLRREALHSDHCYIVEDSVFGAFVWLGKASGVAHSLDWMRVLKRYPANTPMRIARFVEGNEVLAFRLLFSDWKRERTSQSRIEMTVEARRLHEPRCAEAEPLPDNGDADLTDPNSLRVWRVENMGKKSVVPPEHYGVFYEGSSYIIHYRTTGPSRHIIYFWQVSVRYDIQATDLGLGC
jgi:hypothetical protein